jgi:hypothetical protein
MFLSSGGEASLIGRGAGKMPAAQETLKFLFLFAENEVDYYFHI